jgi:signal transduction histidine kinase
MNPTPSETELLLEAFNSFTEISTSLENAYQELQRRVRQLSLELEEKNAYLSSLLESLPCGVMVVDKEGWVITMNHNCRVLMALKERTLPMSLCGILECSGLTLSVEEVLGLTQEARDIAVGSPDAGVRVLSCSSSLMKQGSRVVVLQDVTGIRNLEKRMQESERLAAMGELAVEVAHEIRNPLGGLELFASLLREPDLTKQEREQYLDNIRIGIRSLNTILSNMLSFSRQPEPVMAPVRVDEVLHEIGSFMRPLLKQREIALREEYRDRRAILADREMLRQVFTNLLLNALEALPRGGRIQLGTINRRNAVAVRIKDNGIGIPEEFREVVFTPRFTTTRKGNGLGLAIVQRIVEVHRGRIQLRSERGRGTEFILTFPIGESGR